MNRLRAIFRFIFSGGLLIFLSPYLIHEDTTYFQPNFESGTMKQSPEANRWKPARQEVIVCGDTEVTVQPEPANPN